MRVSKPGRQPRGGKQPRAVAQRRDRLAAGVEPAHEGQGPALGQASYRATPEAAAASGRRRTGFPHGHLWDGEVLRQRSRPANHDHIAHRCRNHPNIFRLLEVEAGAKLARLPGMAGCRIRREHDDAHVGCRGPAIGEERPALPDLASRDPGSDGNDIAIVVAEADRETRPSSATSRTRASA